MLFKFDGNPNSWQKSLDFLCRDLFKNAATTANMHSVATCAAAIFKWKSAKRGTRFARDGSVWKKLGRDEPEVLRRGQIAGERALPYTSRVIDLAPAT
jgi:hypothetical protein